MAQILFLFAMPLTVKVKLDFLWIGNHWYNFIHDLWAFLSRNYKYKIWFWTSYVRQYTEKLELKINTCLIGLHAYWLNAYFYFIKPYISTFKNPLKSQFYKFLGYKEAYVVWNRAWYLCNRSLYDGTTTLYNRIQWYCHWECSSFRYTISLL